MRCYTQDEFEKWLSSRGRSLPSVANGLSVQKEATSDHRSFALAHWIASSLTYRAEVMLWITEWGIWPSSENWHLYYTLRELRGDHRLLHEAPGHLFQAHEMEDLASLLQVCLLNGWGGYILTNADYVNAFFSHDEYIEFYAREDANLNVVRDWYKPV